MPFSKNRRPENRRPGKPTGPPSGFSPAPNAKKGAVRKPIRKKGEKGGGPTIENTGRETAYLDQLVSREQLVAIVLQSGETLRGYVRYYDRDVFSLGPADGGPKLFLRKDGIRYLYEIRDEED
jgi:hypothetical protein